MTSILNTDFTNKVVLEIGTGRGGTTRELVKHLSKFTGSKLITTDIYDGNFSELQEEFKEYSVSIEFIKTDACELNEIVNESIDLIVCNYTLCAINSRPCAAVIALNRFKEVLRKGGILYLEEEFPINNIKNERQEIWAEKWRILKTCSNILRKPVYNEMEKDIVIGMIELLGFKVIQGEAGAAGFNIQNWLEFFEYRLERCLQEIKNENLKSGLREESDILINRAKEVGGMEIPSYKIVARK